MDCRRQLIVAGVLAAGMLIMSIDGAPAQTRFGVRGGIYLDQDDPFAGVHLLHKFDRNWVFNPNFEYVFVDRGSLFTVNLDTHYDLPSRSNVVFWIGGGLGISQFSFEDTNNTDLGLNILTGVSFSRRPVIPYMQLKIMVFDDTQLVLSGGLTF